MGDLHAGWRAPAQPRNQCAAVPRRQQAGPHPRPVSGVRLSVIGRAEERALRAAGQTANRRSRSLDVQTVGAEQVAVGQRPGGLHGPQVLPGRLDHPPSTSRLGRPSLRERSVSTHKPSGVTSRTEFELSRVFLLNRMRIRSRPDPYGGAFGLGSTRVYRRAS